ncbi:CPK33 [Symbiodinium sp. CCMP2592]|nr:CPK33 [Symbiodinium sp. CCMP2592]
MRCEPPSKAYNKLKRAVLQLLTRELSEFQIQELRAKFMALDTHGDGLLSPEELVEGMRHVGYEMSEKELEQVMAALDGSGSQRIGYKEFISALIERRVKFDRQQLFECFKKFDKQGIGRITYQAAVFQMFLNLSPSIAKILKPECLRLKPDFGLGFRFDTWDLVVVWIEMLEGLCLPWLMVFTRLAMLLSILQAKSRFQKGQRKQASNSDVAHPTSRIIVANISISSSPNFLVTLILTTAVIFFVACVLWFSHVRS